MLQNAFFLVFFLSSTALFAFKKQITDEIIIKRIPISGIEEEDVLAVEKLPPAVVEEYNLGKVITLGEESKSTKRNTEEKNRPFFLKVVHALVSFFKGAIESSLGDNTPIGTLRKIEKEKHIHLFPVYKDLPRFGPYILAGLVFSLLFGDMIAFLLLH